RDEEGNPMSDEEIRDELIALVLAGHENTATALAWGLYWTHKIPEVKTKILAELKGLDNTPDPMTIFRLPYLTAACNEILRIYPMIILTFPRLVEQPMELLGYQLEQGKVIVGGIYALHHREDLYPNSKQFRPERFLERQFSYNEFIPFGMGKRRCIGDAFAMFKIKLVLSTILSNYQLALVDKKTEKPQRRGLTIAPANGVQMMLLG
ncbi:MAG: cytochrome P450, partial [Cyanobacteria bacterium J06649_11]